MQTVEIILGQPHEGKTTKLLEKFLEHFNNKELCKTVKPVFITGEESIISLLGFIKNKLNSDVELNTITPSMYDLIKLSKEIGNLENVLGGIAITNLEKSDCVFYIDGVANQIKDFNNKILILCNSFPNKIFNNNNKIFNHTLSVVYTMNRLPYEISDIETTKK